MAGGSSGVVDFLARFFAWSGPKYAAFGILLVAGLWLILIWTGRVRPLFYRDRNADPTQRVTTTSTLDIVLATVAALLVSLMFVAVQLSAASYSPRVIATHFVSAHFIGLGLVFLTATVYLSWQLARSHIRSPRAHKSAETGFVLFATALLLLAPYLWISVRLLQPVHLFRRLLADVTVADFRAAGLGNEAPAQRKLQPVIDIVRRATSEGQLETVAEAVDAMESMVRRFEGGVRDEELSRGIGTVLAERLLELIRYANSLHNFEVSTRILGFVEDLTDFYGARPVRSGVLEFGPTLKALALEWRLRYPPTEYPLEYAQGLFHIGGIYSSLAGIAETGKREYLAAAIRSYEDALAVYTREEFPARAAGTNNNLGAAYVERAAVGTAREREQDLDRAIAAYTAALDAYTRTAEPVRFATVENNLGAAYLARAEMSTGPARTDLYERAIRSYRAALDVRRRWEMPVDYAITQNNLGNAYLGKAGVTRDQEKRDNLELAVRSYQAALDVRTRTSYPTQYAMTENNLSAAYNALADMATGPDQGTLLAQAIASARASLDVYTRREFPDEYATSQDNLGLATHRLMLVGPAEERARHYEDARAAFAAAGTVWTADYAPEQAAELARNVAALDRDWQRLQAAPR